MTGTHRTMRGTRGNDTLIAAADHQVLFGLGGDDILISRFNETTLDGGPGKDILTAEAAVHPTNIMSSKVSHTLIGGDGDDVLTGKAIAESSAIAAVRLLILTGCRLNEIMTLKWSYLDLGAGRLNLPDSKTGAKVVHIGKPAADVLRSIRALPANPWVITGKLPGSRLSDLQPFWQRVRARAEGCSHP